jgi:hypothetical protein
MLAVDAATDAGMRSPCAPVVLREISEPRLQGPAMTSAGPAIAEFTRRRSVP